MGGDDGVGPSVGLGGECGWNEPSDANEVSRNGRPASIEAGRSSGRTRCSEVGCSKYDAEYGVLGGSWCVCVGDIGGEADGCREESISFNVRESSVNAWSNEGSEDILVIDTSDCDRSCCMAIPCREITGAGLSLDVADWCGWKALGDSEVGCVERVCEKSAAKDDDADSRGAAAGGWLACGREAGCSEVVGEGVASDDVKVFPVVVESVGVVNMECCVDVEFGVGMLECEEES